MSRKPQNKRKRDTAYHPELHTRNVNSREIFKNDTLAYVISLIEHKSDIDYDVAMQLLRYMTVIWKDYKDMQNKKVAESSKRKNFRYPLIVPIVYYEGTRKWTAERSD